MMKKILIAMILIVTLGACTKSINKSDNSTKVYYRIAHVNDDGIVEYTQIITVAQ